MVVVAIRFHEVDDVEAISLVFSHILHSKIVPLSKSICAIVILEVKFVLRIRYLDCFAQIC